MRKGDFRKEFISFCFAFESEMFCLHSSQRWSELFTNVLFLEALRRFCFAFEPTKRRNFVLFFFLETKWFVYICLHFVLILWEAKHFVYFLRTLFQLKTSDFPLLTLKPRQCGRVNNLFCFLLEEKWFVYICLHFVYLLRVLRTTFFLFEPARDNLFCFLLEAKWFVYIRKRFVLVLWEARQFVSLHMHRVSTQSEWFSSFDIETKTMRKGSICFVFFLKRNDLFTFVYISFCFFESQNILFLAVSHTLLKILFVLSVKRKGVFSAVNANGTAPYAISQS